MVPARLDVVRALPLSASGKLDRRALKALASERGPATAIERRAPIMPRVRESVESLAASDLEHRLANIWRAVLNVTDIRREDSFFALGGHSLLAVRLAFQIERNSGRV